MIRGIQKNVIWVQTPKSGCFEEAYFVVRRERVAQKQKGNEMLREATRMIEECEGENAQVLAAKRKRTDRLLTFLCGMISGSLAATLVWLILCLVA
jgi:hypothetical protein